MFNWHKCKSFLSATSKSASHQSCFCGKSVIGPQTCCPDDLTGDEERVNYQTQNRTQEAFERIWDYAVDGSKIGLKPSKFRVLERLTAALAPRFYHLAPVFRLGKHSAPQHFVRREREFQWLVRPC